VEEKKERFQAVERVFEFVGEVEFGGRTVEGEEAWVFAMKEVVKVGHVGAEAFGESLAGKSGEIAQRMDAPEAEQVEGEGR
jgi:hypothetical protein